MLVARGGEQQHAHQRPERARSVELRPYQPDFIVGQNAIPRVLGGLGLVIVSTSQGIMTGTQARKGQLGGEILAYVW